MSWAPNGRPIAIVQCNHAEGDSTVPFGARAYVLQTAGAGHSVYTLIRSRARRWVKHWYKPTKLCNFRAKVIYPENPMYGELWGYQGWGSSEVNADVERLARLSS